MIFYGITLTTNFSEYLQDRFTPRNKKKYMGDTLSRAFLLAREACAFTLDDGRCSYLTQTGDSKGPGLSFLAYLNCQDLDQTENLKIDQILKFVYIVILFIQTACIGQVAAFFLFCFFSITVKLAKLHDMYLYKTTIFPHQPIRSVSKVAVLHRFYCTLEPLYKTRRGANNRTFV